jgi:hypothetical protein
MSAFEQLASIREDDKKQIRRLIRHHQNRLSVVHVCKKKTEMALLVFGMTISIASGYVLPVIAINRWTGIHRSVALSLSSVFLVGVAYIILVGPWMLSIRWTDRDYVAFMQTPALGCAISIYLGYIYLICRAALRPGIVAHHWWMLLGVAGILGAVVMVTSLITLSLLILSLAYAFSQRVRAFYPDSVLVNELVELIAHLEKNPKRWGQVRFTCETVSRLESIALCIDRDLRRRLGTREDGTDIWLEARLGQVANSFRAMKKWVLTPMGDTRTQLVMRLASVLRSAALGRWDDLPREDVEKISRPHWWHIRILRILGAVFVGGAPVLMFWLFQRTPKLALTGPVRDYLEVGVMIWAALALITLFDPSFGAKIAILKDVSQLLPFSGRKKE